MKDKSLKNKDRDINMGGDAGEVFIATRKMVGDGKIISDGGDGNIGGKGGRIIVISKDNQFTGEVSAKGGKSYFSKVSWYQTWWGILMLGIIASAIVASVFYFL